MTTQTLVKQELNLEVVRNLAELMIEKGYTHIHPNTLAKKNKLRNENISEMIVDEDGNVFLNINDDIVCLPQLISM